MSWPFGSRNLSGACSVVDGVAGGVPTADTGAPWSNAVSQNQTAGRTASATTKIQLLLRQAGERLARFVGLRSDLTRGGVVRYILGQKAHRYGVRLDGAGDHLTTGGIATSSDASIEIVFRVNSSWTPGDDAIAYHGSAFGAATRDWYLGIEAATGKVHAVFDRYASSAQDAVSSTTVQDGRIKSALVTINGSAETAVLYMDGVSGATASSIGAFAANTDPIVIGNAGGYAAVEIFSVSVWDEELSAAQALARYDRVRLAAEAALVQGFNFGDGSGNPANIVSGGVAMTNTGGTWVERANTSARNADSGAVTVHGPWRERQALRLRGASHLQTGTTLSFSPVQTFAGWIDIPEEAPDDTLVWLATMGDTTGTQDWVLAFGPSGLELYAARTTGAPAVTLTPSVLSGVTVFVAFTLDGFTDLLRMRIWDTGEAEIYDSGSVALNSFVAASSESFSLGAAPSGAAFASVDFFGDVVVANRLLANSEIQAIRRGHWTPQGDPETLLHYRIGDVTTGSMVDHGSAGEDLTVTGETFVPVRHPLIGTVDLGHGSRHDGIWGERLAADTAYEEALFLLFDPAQPAGQIEVEQFYLHEGEDIEGFDSARDLSGRPEGYDPMPAGFVPAQSVNGYPYAGRDGRKMVGLPLIKCTANDREILESAFRDKRIVAVLPDSTISGNLTWSQVVIGTIKSFSGPLNPSSSAPLLFNVSIVVESLPGWGR